MKFNCHSSSVMPLVIGLVVILMNVSPIHGDGTDLPTNLGGYFPKSNVMDAAAIDQDQEAIVNYMQIGNMKVAHDIYRNGANSRPYAVLTLTENLQASISQGHKLMGYVRPDSRHIYDVYGTAMYDHEKGDDKLYFLYDVPSDRPSACQVGALPEDVQKTDGCLQDSGTLRVSERAPLEYSYDFQVDNKSGRSIDAMSGVAKASMHDCEFCPIETYEKYKDYYGSFTYGDDLLTAAFGIAVNVTDFNRGNADFSIYGLSGRQYFIEKGILVLNLWMFLIRDMEVAVNSCVPGGAKEDQAEAIAYWDEAVAFYVGYLEGNVEKGDGTLLYDLANQNCKYFKTCGEGTNQDSGNSAVNIRIMRSFEVGQNDIYEGRCDDAKSRKEDIVRTMAIPLIQGTILYSYLRDYVISPDNEGDREMVDAIGAAYAASVIPLVHACNKEDAAIIYDYMRLGLFDSDFPKVKGAFQRNYACLQVTCQDIGGPYYAKTGYYAGAEPCSDGSSAKRAGEIIGGLFGAIVAVGIIVVVYRKCCKRQGVDHKYLVGEPKMESPKVPPPSVFHSNDDSPDSATTNVVL